eukprot:CFRG2655T1
MSDSLQQELSEYNERDEKLKCDFMQMTETVTKMVELLEVLDDEKSCYLVERDMLLRQLTVAKEGSTYSIFHSIDIFGNQVTSVASRVSH